MTELTGPHHFTMEQWIGLAPFERYLGMKIIQADQGRAILTMPFIFNLAQGAGLMHGGALVSLADTAVVIAIKTLLNPGTHFATIHLQTDFLAPVTRGVVAALAETKRQSDYMLNGNANIYLMNPAVNEQAAFNFSHNSPIMKFSSIFKVSKHKNLKP